MEGTCDFTPNTPHEKCDSPTWQPIVKQVSQDWAEIWAKDFHDTYERSAPQFGYETRKESAKPWAEVPENNRKLMIAVCAEVLCRFMNWRAEQFDFRPVAKKLSAELKQMGADVHPSKLQMWLERELHI